MLKRTSGAFGWWHSWECGVVLFVSLPPEIEPFWHILLSWVKILQADWYLRGKEVKSVIKGWLKWSSCCWSTDLLPWKPHKKEHVHKEGKGRNGLLLLQLISSAKCRCVACSPLPLLPKAWQASVKLSLQWGKKSCDIPFRCY